MLNTTTVAPQLSSVETVKSSISSLNIATSRVPHVTDYVGGTPHISRGMPNEIYLTPPRCLLEGFSVAFVADISKSSTSVFSVISPQSTCTQLFWPRYWKHKYARVLSQAPCSVVKQARVLCFAFERQNAIVDVVLYGTSYRVLRCKVGWQHEVRTNWFRAIAEEVADRLWARVHT